MARTNIARAVQVLEEIALAGTKKALLCAGARNAPLAEVLFNSTGMELVQLFEERSAAFFALGNTRLSGRPTVVVTTSGTAAAELLPAVIEAHYCSLPLIVVTADRPPEYRGTGAPQSIDQLNLFGSYVDRCIDVTDSDPLSLDGWTGKRPIHINVCFDEPLIDAQVPSTNLNPTRSEVTGEVEETLVDSDESVIENFCDSCKAPLVILGEIHRDFTEEVSEFLIRFGAPVYAESLSQLREDPRLRDLRIRSGDGFVRAALSNGDFDGVLRIGGVPTLRAWRDLDSSLNNLPVLSLSQRPFGGLKKNRDNTSVYSLEHIKSWTGNRELNGATQKLLERDGELFSKMETCFRDFPRGEPSLIRELSSRLQSGAFVYLGNSLPIRQWDLAAATDSSIGLMAANRGANGIDGQVSTFLGMCSEGRTNLALIGDLTALYDSAGFYAASQLTRDVDFTVAIINNGGGRIFGHIFDNERFQIPHDLTFENVAKQWSLEYEVWTEVPRAPEFEGRRLLEIRPEKTQTDGFYKAYRDLWRSD